MSRLLLQALFAVAASTFCTHWVLADDADVSDAPAGAAVPAASPADAEKGAEATEETASPTPAENKDSAESSGEKGATADSAADPTTPKTETDSDSKPEDSSTEDTKPTETKPAEAKSPAAEDPATKTGAADAETAATDVELESWQKLHQQWLMVDKKLREAELEYYHSPKAEQFALRGAFEKMIETEAIPLLAKLRAEVMKAYAAKPNENVEVVRLLIGFMVNHARMQEVAEAKEIVELLIDNKCDEKYVMVASKMPGLRPASLDILEQMEKRYKDALSANDSDATPDSGDSSSPVNEKPSGDATDEKSEDPSPPKGDPE